MAKGHSLFLSYVMQIELLDCPSSAVRHILPHSMDKPQRHNGRCSLIKAVTCSALVILYFSFDVLP